MKKLRNETYYQMMEHLQKERTEIRAILEQAVDLDEARAEVQAVWDRHAEETRGGDEILDMLDRDIKLRSKIQGNKEPTWVTLTLIALLLWALVRSGW